MKDPTRAATNPGLCTEVDERLHNWATNNNLGISAIIAGHTHRAVFENLSISERRYLELKMKIEGIRVNHRLDKSYYNDGSCVHPSGVTSLEIIYENRIQLRLVEWQYMLERNGLIIGKIMIGQTKD